MKKKTDVEMMKNADSKESSAKSRMAGMTSSGDARRGDTGRTLGAATKDSRHGVNTDRSTSRRTESRRTGSMCSESKPKSQRKNI